MNDRHYTSISGIWFAFWLIRLVIGLINQRDYLLNTSDGRLQLTFYILMALLGLGVMLYFLLRKHGNKIAFRISSKGRCPECYAKLKGHDFCPKCGADPNRNTDRTCWYCGYVEKDRSVTSCPKCGREFKK